MSLWKFLFRRLFDRRGQHVTGSSVAGHVTQLRNVLGDVHLPPPADR